MEQDFVLISKSELRRLQEELRDLERRCAAAESLDLTNLNQPPSITYPSVIGYTHGLSRSIRARLKLLKPALD